MAPTTLVLLLLPDPLKPGDRVELEVQSSLPVTGSAWTPSGSNECPDCLVNTYYPQENLWVSVTVFDAEGCPAVDSLYLLVEPNGNTHFSLFSRYPLPVLELSVYDRWGEQMFQRLNFNTNTPEEGWDGTFQGKEALPGVYVFMARVELNSGNVVVLKGDILLYR